MLSFTHNVVNTLSRDSSKTNKM
jgi:hypothetical protein